MKLVIGSKEYELQSAMEKASLNDLYAMTLQAGIGMGTLGANLETIDTNDLAAAMDKPEMFQALRCLIFLARRYAGEHCTVQSANDFPFSELSFIDDAEPAEEVAAADPTQLPE